MNPMLEVYVLWHPAERNALAIAEDMAAHFHGGVYASLLAGSMEVYTRSVGWKDSEDAPRSILWPGAPAAEDGLQAARFVAIVPIVGLEMNRAVNNLDDPWHAYFEQIVAAQQRDPAHVQLFPLRQGSSFGGRLAELLAQSHNQLIAEPDPQARLREPERELRCRDLAQGLAQWISPPGAARQLKVFISHTKRQGTSDEPVASLVEAVRSVLGSGRIGSFYDAHELQPGEDWDRALRTQAASSALLAVRTDLYATREWCQREMLTAKEHGMPIVVLDALSAGEARGSFLMDHAPRIPMRCDPQGGWNVDAIRRAVNLLADAWLQRVLWLQMRVHCEGHASLGRYWWAPQAPEPSTLMRWLSPPTGVVSVAGGIAAEVPDASAPPRMAAQSAGSDLRILHPDPPLADDECDVLQRMVTMAGYGQLDLTTPRLLAARGA